MDDTNIEEIDLVIAGEFYPKTPLQSDDGVQSIPFTLLPGESGVHRGHTSEGLIILTSYRLYHCEGLFFNIPLGLVDYVECRDIFYLYIYCKDARTFRCIFDNSDETQKWLKRIQEGIKVPEKVENHFAFRFFSWAREEQKINILSQPHSFCDVKDSAVLDITAEAERMGFDLKNVWKISKVNEDYQLCPSYPRYIIVPTSIHDDHLRDLASFRYSRRIPAVVWRHQQNGCIIARSSQPRMGILSWRNANDEKLIQAISDACISDPGYETRVNGREESFSLRSDMDSDISIFCGQTQEEKPVQKKLLIIDARSYAAAMTNRAKGGGYECDGYYSNCEIQYMGLANIHTIRNSFNCVRALCAAPDDQSWLSSLENTKWMHHISGLIRAALLVVDAVDVEKRPVLVHCSDGWDRTPQIVALAEIMLDPYYRTKKGFQILVEREWLEFGHKFADRCGHSDCTDDRNERSPVFLQWLDCIYQLLEQFECHFEFNQHYLARLALHTYSCLFGTFMCNTDQRRQKIRVMKRTFSVWPMLNERSQFHNYLYNHSNEVLRPSCQIRNLKFWCDVYLPNNPVNLGKTAVLPVEEPLSEENTEKTTNLVKTKSCDNLPFVEHSLGLQRRNSDPNLVENMFNETVSYPKVPELKDDTSFQTHMSEDNSEIIKMCNGVCVCSNGMENEVGVERTKFKCKELDCNLILREPTIDGSTDTLVSENGLLQDKYKKEYVSDETPNSSSEAKLTCSVSTSTSNLPLSVEEVLQTVTQSISYSDVRLPNWCQNALGAYVCNKRTSDSSNSCSCSYTTPNHSRTPSSGFPATPCDDPSDTPTLKNGLVHQTLDVDGLNIVSNVVQERIKKLILHYKNKVANLQYELSSARCEVINQLCRYGKDMQGIDGEDAPSLSDSACSGEQHAESNGSESSWDILLVSEQSAANCVV